MKFNKKLMLQHTEDVCYQASRRLEIFIKGYLNIASFFEKRWVNNEFGDFSTERFQEFSKIMLEKMPGCTSIKLISKEMKPIISIHQNLPETIIKINSTVKKVMNEVRLNRSELVSESYKDKDGDIMFSAIYPLFRIDAFIGYIVIDFNIKYLIDYCIKEKMRTEFDFKIEDNGWVIYNYNYNAIQDPKPDFSTSQSIPVANRNWKLTLRGVKSFQHYQNNYSLLLIPIFGTALSFILSGLAYLLFERLHMYKEARDSAMNEIYKREKTQNELKDSENRYRNVFGSSTDGFLILDKEGFIVDANPSALSIYGYSFKELINTNFNSLLAHDYKELFYQFMDKLKTDGNIMFDSVHIKKNGSMIYVEVRGSIFHFRNDQRILVTLTDITEKKKSEQQRALLSRKIMIAQEEERARIARELHDELGQLITALHIELDWLKKKTGSSNKDSSPLFENAIGLVEKSANELRTICKGLRPPLLDDLGLEPAIKLLVTEFEEQSDIETNLNIKLPEAIMPLNENIALCIYRILQESLTNIRKHSKALSVSISLFTKDEELIMQIYDNGKGFDLSDFNEFKGSGIAGMRERSNLINGKFEINSTPNDGSQIILRIQFPVKREAVQ
jgi:PAS domain S-box-containing protein